MVLGLDPQFYIVEYARTSYPLIFILGRALALNSDFLLRLCIVIGRFWLMTFALYEAERVMAITYGSMYIGIYTAGTLVGLISKIVTNNKRRIQVGLFHRHITYYTILQIGIQAVERMLKVSLLMEIFAATVGLVSITFVSVRLGHLLPGYLLLCAVFAGCFTFLLAKTVLSKTGRAFKNVMDLWRSFKGVDVLLGMRCGVRQWYLRDVRRLPVLKIPIGIGGIVFATLDENLNVRLSNLFIDLTVNALVSYDLQF